MSVVIRKKSNGLLYLDIHYSGGRTRPSTGLKDTPSNRKLLEESIIPNIELEIRQGIYVPKAKRVKTAYTLEEYSAISFNRNSNLRREHVQKSIESHFHNHIVNKFGKRLISSITPVELLDWQNKKLEDYSETTVKKLRSIFNTVFQDAFYEGVIELNPFEKVRYPKKRVQNILDDEDNRANPFSLEEIHLLIKRADGYLKNFIVIMSFSGVRPGELVALKWEDVDFDDEVFYINKTRNPVSYTHLDVYKRQQLLIV